MIAHASSDEMVDSFACAAHDRARCRQAFSGDLARESPAAGHIEQYCVVPINQPALIIKATGSLPYYGHFQFTPAAAAMIRQQYGVGDNRRADKLAAADGARPLAGRPARAKYCSPA